MKAEWETLKKVMGSKAELWEHNSPHFMNSAPHRYNTNVRVKDILKDKLGSKCNDIVCCYCARPKDYKSEGKH